MIIVGLTGSIGMGKTTTANMFRDRGISVQDADAVVHELYQAEAVPLIEATFPGTTSDGQVDRKALRAQVIDDPQAMAHLEGLIHPLVEQRRKQFLQHCRDRKEAFCLLDIPLLFETGIDKTVDRIIVVTATADIQRKRVLARPGMTQQVFESILARQMPDAQKRQRADFLVDTSHGMEAAHQQVDAIIKTLRERP